jgi:hypothetical protein
MPLFQLNSDESNKDLSTKKLNILSWGALFYGLFFGIFGLTFLGDDGGKVMFVCGALLFAAGVFGVFNLRKKKINAENDKMNHILYDLIKKNNGKITLLEFAVATNLEAADARKFLESKAAQFGTVVDVDSEGIINYIFK